NYTTPLRFITGGDSSSHYYDPSINGGTLTLMRQGQSSDSRNCSIQIWGIDLDNIPIPSEFSKTHKFPSKNGYTLYGGFGLWDSAAPSNITTNGPDDSYNYTAVTSDNFSIRLISKKNDILKGTFEGQIKTASGLVKSVSNGEFRIKIVRKS
ncbi:MAG: hypothetical protein M3142_16280, partial [Bacteroidota bacterium]|nr:hypothetical protein [Bacteroidota bacterium]